MPALTVRFDPHVHSDASYDSELGVRDLLASASQANLDAVAVTDHDTVANVDAAADLAPEYDLVLVPGVEVSTAAGHLLALGIDWRPDPGLPLPETVQRVRSDGGIAVVPHPFQRSRHGVRRRDIDDVDGIEVHNALAMTGYRNRHARQFATAHDYPMLGGSDAHTADMVGRSVTTVTVDSPASEPTALTPREILDGVRAGATTVDGQRSPITHCVCKFLRHARYRPERALRRGVETFLSP